MNELCHSLHYCLDRKIFARPNSASSFTSFLLNFEYNGWSRASITGTWTYFVNSNIEAELLSLQIPCWTDSTKQLCHISEQNYWSSASFTASWNIWSRPYFTSYWQTLNAMLNRNNEAVVLCHISEQHNWSTASFTASRTYFLNGNIWSIRASFTFYWQTSNAINEQFLKWTMKECFNHWYLDIFG